MSHIDIGFLLLIVVLLFILYIQKKITTGGSFVKIKVLAIKYSTMFTCVHFSGGGFAVLGYIGFHYYLELSRNNELILDYRLTGMSAGAIIAYLVYIGYKSNKMMTEMLNIAIL